MLEQTPYNSSASTKKWQRFWRNPRASFASIALVSLFAFSLFGGFLLPPPDKVCDPATLESFRRARVRFTPLTRTGRLDVSRSLNILSENGCTAFSPSLVSGSSLADSFTLPDNLLTAIENRFNNVPSPSATFDILLPDDSPAQISLTEFSPRHSPVKSVRLRLRDVSSSRQHPISRTIPRSALDGIENLSSHDAISRLATAANLPASYIDPVSYRAEFYLEPVAWPFRPVPGHPCGIDSAGRDVLSRIVAGTRIALVFGLVLVLSSMLLGIAIGAIQGYYGSVIDIASQRIIEIWSALPFLYVMMLICSVLGRSFSLLLLCYGLFNWIGISYYVRAEFLRLRSRPFVDAARCQGLSDAAIIFRHILPNALTPLVTLLPFSLIGAIASISALDFLGFGLPPLTPSLGELLSQSQQDSTAWWLVLFPALTLFTIMLLAVFIGEGLRDAFDPKPSARYK